MKNLFLLSILFFSLHILPAQTSIDNRFFDEVDVFLKKHVQSDRIDYYSAKNDPKLPGLLEKIANANLEGLTAQALQAFYINAYNILVIDGVAKIYPIQSVQEQGGFFDTQTHLVAGESITLNELEKDLLLKQFGDARFHFVLVCGAISCPPITSDAYTPEKLESQLEAQTQKALNDPSFIRVNKEEQKVELSEIFDWYVKDFGGSKSAVLNFINSYRETKIPEEYKIGYYAYDWSLNEGRKVAPGIGNSDPKGNNASRYVVSAAIPKGNIELKIFNNLYTQQTTENGEIDPVNRSTYFTTSLSFLYGINSRFNFGIDARYRRVRNARLPASSFDVFSTGDPSSSRQGLTTLGPKIRWAPFKSLSNFSIQSTLSFPLAKEWEGNDNQPFLDWNGAVFWTQFFNDFSLGSNFSLFTEVDFLVEDIGRVSSGASYRTSTPATLILSFFPTPKATLYGLTNYSPFWQETFDYFAQLGVGAKYQITSKFELEILYTSFTNKSLTNNNGLASTLNFGIRINR